MLIGISGKAMAGKDTLGMYLKEILEAVTGEEYYLIAYADTLKEKLMADFDLSRDQMYTALKEVPDKRYPKAYKNSCGSNCQCGHDTETDESSFWTPREIMQFIGTECYRSIDNNFWVNALFKRIQNNNLQNVIVTDCRFETEIDAIIKHGGQHIRIYRENTGSVYGLSHSSETELDKEYFIDVKVTNNGTLDALKNTANDVATMLVAFNMSQQKNLMGVRNGN